MAVVQIADKPTLDEVRTIVGEMYPGSGSIVVILLGIDEGFRFNVRSANSVFDKTIIYHGEPYIFISTPWFGNYTLSWTGSNGQTKTETVTINAQNSVVVTIEEYPAFADVTWVQLASILTKAYEQDSDFSLSDIWAVGDTKSIDIAATSAEYVSESQPSCTRDIIIRDFEHDDLATAINGHTKAAVTLGLSTALPNNGYLSSTTHSSGWYESSRRSWCNEIFYSALPASVQPLIKEVIKYTGCKYTGESSYTLKNIVDKCWLASMLEATGSSPYRAVSGEGSEYTVKTGLANYGVSRTISTQNNDVYFYNGGTQSQTRAGDISPNFCL